MNINEIVEAEWAQRRADGLPPYHSVDQNDLGFSTHDPLNAHGLNPGLQQFLKGNYEEMLDIWKYSFDNIMGCVAMDEGFIDQLAGKAFDGLPMVTHVRPVPDAERVVYIVCDGKYWEKFGRVLAWSARDQAVQIHLFDADPADAARMIDKGLLPRAGLAVEYPNAGPEYYHAVRFIRLRELIETTEVVMLDADSIVNRFSIPRKAIAMRLRPARAEPWNQFNASVVVASNKAMPYWDRVAGYIHHYFEHGRLRWQIDQAALFCVWKTLRHRYGWRITCLDEKAVDYDYNPEGSIWNNSGSQKHQATDPTRKPYRDRFAALEKELNAYV